jgi:hypothetical protein
MKYLLVGVDDTTNLSDFYALLHTYSAVKTVEIIESNIPTEKKNGSNVLTRNLAIPGVPLSTSELEVLSTAMEGDTVESGIPIDVVIAHLEQKISQWS